MQNGLIVKVVENSKTGKGYEVLINSWQDFAVLVEQAKLSKAVNRAKAVARKSNRNKAMIYDFINSNLCKGKFVCFVTLTFKDEKIEVLTTSITKFFRRKKINYCLVEEYGKNTHRRHYHGILGSDFDLNFFSFPWGFSKIDELVNEMQIEYCVKYSLKDYDRSRILILDKF